jgi:hypothetical protein
MPEPDLSLVFVHPLNGIGVRYMISGGIAAILYGEPRLTNDVDFVVFLRNTDVPRLTAAFPASDFYVPPQTVIADAIAQSENGHFNFIHHATGYKADFYTAGQEDLTAWGFRNCRKIELSGEPVVIAPAEYVIIRKLEYFRDGGSEKHLRDIRSMLTISAAIIDRGAILDWVRQRGLEAEWKQV